MAQPSADLVFPPNPPFKKLWRPAGVAKSRPSGLYASRLKYAVFPSSTKSRSYET